MEYEKMLTKGTLKAIMNYEEVKDPVMQVLGIRKITAAGANERYRLLISDGQNLNSFAMLATQLNSIILFGELTEFAIVKIKRHILSSLTDRTKGSKQVMILIDLDVIKPGDVVGSKIGDPKPIVDNPGHMVSNGTSASVSTTRKPQSNSVAMPTVQTSVINNGLQSVIDVDNTHPIDSLSPYQNKCTIRAGVVCKTPVGTWRNQKGDGKIFIKDLVDESGEIRATAFNSEFDKLFDMMEVNKVNIITHGNEKMLTKGTLKAIMNYEEVKDPVMQVLGIRKITAAGRNERYRLLISDGQNLNSFAMLATQLNSIILSGELTEFAIVKIKRHILSSLTDRTKGSKQVMILIDLEVIKPGDVVGSKIGDPKPIVDNSGL